MQSCSAQNGFKIVTVRCFYIGVYRRKHSFVAQIFYYYYCPSIFSTFWAAILDCIVFVDKFSKTVLEDYFFLFLIFYTIYFTFCIVYGTSELNSS